MNDNTTISTFQLFKLFPDAESARIYLESRLWPQGVRCPVCELGVRIGVRKGGYYRCNQCKEDFTVRKPLDTADPFWSLTADFRPNHWSDENEI